MSKEYSVQLYMSHYVTIKVEADSEEEALSTATGIANTDKAYNRDYSSVYSAEIVNDSTPIDRI